MENENIVKNQTSENTDLQHVQLPNSMTDSLEISPKDLIIYLTIKRFMNKDTKEAYPSLDTISKISGASVNTVRKCIGNLEKEGYLEVTKINRKNFYKFKKQDNFEPFSYAFLDKQDLTFTEKAYLVASQQYMFKESGEGKISLSNRELSKRINISEKTIRRCDQSLEAKEYLQIIPTSKRDPETGCAVREKFYHLTKLEQAIVFVLKNHEDRIQSNTEDIEALRKEVEELKELAKSQQKDMQILLQQLKKEPNEYLI